MTNAGHMIEIEAILGTIRISEVGITLEMIGIKKSHMIEEEAGVEIIQEDLEGIEDTEDLRKCGRSTFRDKSEERKCHYCREPGYFIRVCQK